jgi:hypothetical protein
VRDGVQPAGTVVGYACAIDGEVKGVRWFAHHRVFAMFRELLINTVIVDAITARTGEGTSAAPPSAKSVVAFVRGFRKVAEKTRETQAENVNEYTAAEKSYRATTVFKPKARKGARPPKPMQMSVDMAAD